MHSVNCHRNLGGVTAAAQKLGRCAAAQYGFGSGKTQQGIDLARIASEVGSIPVSKSFLGVPITEGARTFTNVLNATSLKLGWNRRFQNPELRSFTKGVFGSVRIGTVLGRANALVGGFLFALDAASIIVCASRK